MTTPIIILMREAIAVPFIPITDTRTIERNKFRINPPYDS
jgi:hypothetical protein